MDDLNNLSDVKRTVIAVKYESLDSVDYFLSIKTKGESKTKLRTIEILRRII